MVAELTFTVELDKIERQVLEMVVAGKSDWQISRALKGKSKFKLMRNRLQLRNSSLDVVELTRDGKIGWNFQPDPPKRLVLPY